MSYFPALNRLGFDANAVNFGVVAVQRFCGGKVVAVVVISMMRSGLIERRCFGGQHGFRRLDWLLEVLRCNGFHYHWHSWSTEIRVVNTVVRAS